MQSNLLLTKEIEGAASVLRAVNHDLRQKILYLLEKNGKLTVTQVYEALGIDQSVCSQHLGILRKEGVVATEMAGKCRNYYIVLSRLQEINAYSKKLSAS
jgi:predicted transcriptional regulator